MGMLERRALRDDRQNEVFPRRQIWALSTIYRQYIDCLNRQDWAGLEQFVHSEVHYNGKRKVAFAENVFYEFDERKINAVWSVIDKAAIERQL